MEMEAPFDGLLVITGAYGLLALVRFYEACRVTLVHLCARVTLARGLPYLPCKRPA